jgi:iron complex outermembrane recepter protein
MKLNKTFVVSIYFLLLSPFAFSKEPVKITIKDQQNLALPGATVKITNATDSITQFSITDFSGISSFTARDEGVYLVSVSYVGYEPIDKTILVSPGSRSFEFQMLEQTLALGEVTVTARRPVIRQDGDKMIIDPEPLANISTNTMEMLETVPGLFVDQDGGIFLNSATPAAIYINGREQRMGQQNITSLLRSLPPGSIQYIEVIRTPSTRYDASTSGGIINIVLKKGVRLGRFGGFNMGMNQGVLGNRFAGFNLNESGDKTTFYLNASYNHNATEENLNSFRLLASENNLQQSAVTQSRSDQGFVGFGLSYDARERLNFSYDSRLNGSLPRSASSNTNFMRTPDDNLFSENSNAIDNNSRAFNIQQDLGAIFKIDSVGSVWDTRFSYSYNSSDATQDYLTRFLFPGNFILEGTGDNFQQRHFLNFQSDLTWRLPYSIALETGFKTSYQDYESSADYYFMNNGSLEEDILRTNAFNYQENINAGYLQASKDLPFGLLLKTGVRLEHTRMNGFQTVPSDTSFLVDRVDLFPYAFLSRRLFEIAGFELRSYMIYRRSINRPDYQNLNPYVRYLDQFLYETGNPALKPQFTENYEINISMDEMPIFAVGRSYIKDIFSGVVYQDENDSNVAVRTFDNLGKNTETYFRAVAGIPPVNRYFMFAGAQYNLNHYEGLYENEPLSFKRGSWRFFTFHSLSITRNTRLTLMGFMMHNGMFNFYELNTFGQVNLGLSHNMLDRRLQITLNARDVFRTMETRFSLNQGLSPATGSRYMDNQRIGINIRYNFGIRKREEQRPPMMNFDMVD